MASERDLRGLDTSWRHAIRSRVVTSLASPRHRGIDLVASASAPVQRIEGEIRYGDVDKALEGESVELFACRAGRWTALGPTSTDDEGHFVLDLTGTRRLPIGVRTLYVSVVGDRSGADFVAMVAPEGTMLAVSDIDGTLTTSENAFPFALVGGAAVSAHPGAAAALTTLRNHRFYPVYTTARGRYFTEQTRRWLESQGFPRGPLRLPSAIATLPGDATVEYKASTLRALESQGLWPVIGVGNRATDVAAYGAAGIDASWIFVKLPEFEGELEAALAEGRAVGVESYQDLATYFEALGTGP